MSTTATKTVLVVEDSPLKTFIDRVVVPALKDRFLAEQQAAKPSKTEAA